MKVKKAIEKGNMEGAKIYAQNAIRKKNEQLNYLKLGCVLSGSPGAWLGQARGRRMEPGAGHAARLLPGTCAAAPSAPMRCTASHTGQPAVECCITAGCPCAALGQGEVDKLRGPSGLTTARPAQRRRTQHATPAARCPTPNQQPSNRHQHTHTRAGRGWTRW